MIATAPGKLILSGEYAVLDGAPALVVAIDRRAIARLGAPIARGTTPFLDAVADELARRYGADHTAVERAARIAVDSSALYEGGEKLGLGSSAAVTVAAVALALGAVEIDRAEVLAVALAAHAAAQGQRGARGSGADIAAAVYGGAIVFEAGRVQQHAWPRSVALVPFFTGRSADTAKLVESVVVARASRPGPVEVSLAAIADASRAIVAAPDDAAAIVDAFQRAADATDQLALETGIELVPACVPVTRTALRRLGGTAKTTGAGGGDVGIAVVPSTVDATEVTAILIECGCQPLQLALDEQGVDLRPDAQ